MNNPLITIKDVAKRLGISPSTIRSYIAKKDWDNVPKPKIKIGRSWRWERHDLEAFISGRLANHKVADKRKVRSDFAKYMY